MHLGDALRLGDGCGVLRLGDVGLKWGSQARKVGGEFGRAFLQGGVDEAAVLCDNHRGGVNRGFGLALFQVEVYVPSFFTRCAQYPSSSARYTQVLSNPYLSMPGTIRRMFWANFLFLF